MVAHADVVVVGSGPCGVIAALMLAEAGRRVILLEAGRRVDAAALTPDPGRTFAKHFWDGGMRVMRGSSMVPTLQVRALGGGTIFNSAICMRPSADALERWSDDYGVSGLDLEAHLDWSERFFDVGPVADHAFGRRNLLFREGCEALGWKTEALPRSTPGCIGSGQCLTGCRVEGKKSADRRGVPEFLAAGGIVWTGVDVERVIVRGGRVLGVEGHVVTENGTRRATARVLADTTILAAGVMATPTILQRGGVDAPPIGANLQIHPSAFAMARFDEDVLPWTGATQGMHCTEHMDRGIKLEDLWASSAVFATKMPPAGRAFKRAFSQMRQLGTWATWIGTADSFGAVRAMPGGLVDYTYEIGSADLRRLHEGIVHLSDLSFAAGASEVFLGIKGLPPTIRAEDMDRLKSLRLEQWDLPLASNHVFGSMRMGRDARTSATDADGRVHGVEGCIVVDTSLFPDTPGANPMLTGMALARKHTLAMMA